MKSILIIVLFFTLTTAQAQNRYITSSAEKAKQAAGPDPKICGQLLAKIAKHSNIPNKKMDKIRRGYQATKTLIWLELYGQAKCDYTKALEILNRSYELNFKEKR